MAPKKGHGKLYTSPNPLPCRGTISRQRSLTVQKPTVSRFHVNALRPGLFSHLCTLSAMVSSRHALVLTPRMSSMCEVKSFSSILRSLRRSGYLCCRHLQHVQWLHSGTSPSTQKRRVVVGVVIYKPAGRVQRVACASVVPAVLGSTVRPFLKSTEGR
jgi:hypothetical protein